MPFDRQKTSLADLPNVSGQTALRLLEQAAISHSISVEVYGEGSPEVAQSRAELDWVAKLVFEANHRFFVPRENGQNLARDQSSTDLALNIQSAFRRHLSALGVTPGG